MNYLKSVPDDWSLYHLYPRMVKRFPPLPPTFWGCVHAQTLYKERRAHLSRAPRHGLAQHKRHTLLHPRESCAAHASPGLLDEKICSNLKVPSSRQSMRKNKLPPAQSPARSPGEPAKGRGFAQSERSANRHSARARSALGPATLNGS